MIRSGAGSGGARRLLFRDPVEIRIGVGIVIDPTYSIRLYSCYPGIYLDFAAKNALVHDIE